MKHNKFLISVLSSTLFFGSNGVGSSKVTKRRHLGTKDDIVLGGSSKKKGSAQTNFNKSLSASRESLVGVRPAKRTNASSSVVTNSEAKREIKTGGKVREILHKGVDSAADYFCDHPVKNTAKVVSASAGALAFYNLVSGVIGDKRRVVQYFKDKYKNGGIRRVPNLSIEKLSVMAFNENFADPDVRKDIDNGAKKISYGLNGGSGDAILDLVGYFVGQFRNGDYRFSKGLDRIFRYKIRRLSVNDWMNQCTANVFTTHSGNCIEYNLTLAKFLCDLGLETYLSMDRYGKGQNDYNWWIFFKRGNSWYKVCITLYLRGKFWKKCMPEKVDDDNNPFLINNRAPASLRRLDTIDRDKERISTLFDDTSKLPWRFRFVFGF